jgi:hypothetical protein
MLPRRLLLLAVGALCLSSLANAVAADQPSLLTASELAEVLDVHWWTMKLLDTTRPGDGVTIQWIDFSGTGLAGGSATIANNSMIPGAIITFCCLEESGHPSVTIISPDGELKTAFPDISMAGVTFGGLPNGTVAKSGDILLKLIKRGPDGTLDLAPGNHLNPGDLGLRVVMHPAPRN